MPKSGSTKGPKADCSQDPGPQDQGGQDQPAPDGGKQAAKEPASLRPVILALDGVESLLEGVIIRLPLSQLDAAELERLAPDIITCALIWGKYDAIHVINRLNELGYSGQIVVIAEYLPNPGLVERELRAFGPGPRLHLLSQDHSRDDLPH